MGAVLLYESERTRVRRSTLPDGVSVVHKEPLGPDAAVRVRHEAEILERLHDVPGVTRLHGPPGRSALVLQDVPGVSLAEVLRDGPLAMPTALAYGLALARILVAVHGHGVVHKDVNPANVLLTGPDREPVLIDFELAGTFAVENPAFTHHHEMTGTPAYLAPEQTGRTGRPVDHRADLYALGATLYELLTGRPPFAGAEALELVHDILVREPVPVARRDPRIPRPVSDVVARLLEKEPGRRYQSAAGLVHDLVALGDGRGTGLRLGSRDYPARLSAPSRPIGREAECAALQEAFDRARDSAHRTVLVAGAPGVGKSALIGELRPVALAAGGWFVSGKYDQYRTDTASGGVVQSLRALGRLLLAEPDAGTAARRDRIRQLVGPNLGLVAAVLPEFAILTGPYEAPAVHPGETSARLRQGGLDLLRAVVSPQRPLVLALDDLQWAEPETLEFIDSVVIDDDLRGLLLVGAFRPAEVDAAHPLTAMRARWQRLGVRTPVCDLHNLPAADLSALLAEMLRLPPRRAAALAQVVQRQAGGNPYDTVELVNALRRDGLLALTADGWQWDDDTIRRYVGRGDVVDLLKDRIGALAPAAAGLLTTMSLLGGDLRLDALATAAGEPVEQVWQQLTPALEDGLLVLQEGEHRHGGHDAAVLRFGHDRVQQAAYDRLGSPHRAQVRLAVARRLTVVPGRETAAAELYLAVLDDVTDRAEQTRVAAILGVAARHAVRAGNHTVVERLLAAEAQMRATAGTPPGDPVMIALDVARHAALYALGRLDEADAVYAALGRGRDPVQLAAAAAVQISSLMNRADHRNALATGFAALHALGSAVPEADVVAEVTRRLPVIYDWIAAASVRADLDRPALDDARVQAAALLLLRLGTAAPLGGPGLTNWLVLEAHRLWTTYGPCEALAASLTSAGLSIFGDPEDYRTRDRILRHVLAVAEARGYTSAAAHARFIHAMGCSAWLEPLEDGVEQARTAREALLHHGDTHLACISYLPSAAGGLDCASLDDFAAEVESGLLLARRIGQDLTAGGLAAYRQFARSLAGETTGLGEFTGESFDEVSFRAAARDRNPIAVVYLDLHQALAAVIAGDAATLDRATDALEPMLFLLQGNSRAQGLLARAMSLAGRIRAGDPGHPATGRYRAELDELSAWWGLRAIDAPANHRHVGHLVDAERAWAHGDHPAAAAAFDRAGTAGDATDRPWHRALIAERAGLFHLGHGLPRTGRHLLAEARAGYAAWGATAKVAALDERHPFLAGSGPAAPADPHRPLTSRTGALTVEEIDILAVLRASQTLSGETDLDRLRAAVAGPLGALTGATAVSMAVRPPGTGGWLLHTTTADAEVAVPVEEAGRRGMLPLTAFRYAERTREPLLVPDATRDDRFAQDPYLAGLDRCSLLVVPIVGPGGLNAVLLLENRHAAGAFTADRLDAVVLIAGQLAVSLDNALLYRSLEDRVAERTSELEAANRQLEILSTTDALTKLANRRQFAQVLDREWARATRTLEPVSICLIDIDNFKLYNDHYGHLAGDECLRRVATVLAAGARRPADLAARYGGEEFAVILTDTASSGAATVAENARSGIIALAQPHARVAGGIVTISVGHATMVPRADTAPEMLVQAADTALYLAKSEGRNRVRAATGG